MKCYLLLQIRTPASHFHSASHLPAILLAVVSTEMEYWEVQRRAQTGHFPQAELAWRLSSSGEWKPGESGVPLWW